MMDGGIKLSYKDVTDGRTVGRSCALAIKHIRVKTELHAQICFYILSPVNTVIL
jgi:hypothetical protein